MGNLFSFNWKKSDIEAQGTFLGNGCFGKVYKISYFWYWKDYAVKIVDVYDPNIWRMAQRESKSMEKVKGHPNVIFIYATEFDPVRQSLFMWMELCDGDLVSLLNQNRRRYTKQQTIKMMVDLIKGLSYIHGKDVIHRDIKPPNILHKGAIVKLSDFGICGIAEESSAPGAYFQTAIGYIGYRAPEIEAGQRYTYSADVFSLGVTFENMVDFLGPMYNREKARIQAVATEMKRIQPKTRPTLASVRRDLESI